MFAVIKKNEGLVKAVAADSLHEAYDKVMYSDEELEPGMYQLINDQNPDEAMSFEYLPRYIQHVNVKPGLARMIER